MAKLRDCLKGAALDPEDTQEILRRVGQIEKRLKDDGTLSPEHAELLAEKEALTQALDDLALAKRQQVLQIMALGRNVQDVKAHPKGVGVGVMSKLVRDVTENAPWSNIDNRATVIMGRAHARMTEAINAYRPKNLGFSQDEAGVRNMVRELFGINSGDADAKAYAKMWGETSEWLRQRFNRAGGQVAKLEEWGLPQYHDPIRVKRMGLDNWKRSISDLLDWDKMAEKLGPDVDMQDIDAMLTRSYHRITTEGLVDMVPGKRGTGKKLANRHTDPRFFIFKDGEAWLKYHDMAGHADIYTTLTDHIHRTSSEIALLEIMGPNPEASFRYLHDLALKDGYSQWRLGFLDNVWDVVSGKVNATQSVRFADFMSSFRHLTVAAKLGGAFLSSISDAGFQRMTRSFNGLPGVFGLRKIMAQMNPANEADRIFAVKMGLTAEAWMNRAMAANRFTEVTGANSAAKISDAVMRASLLSSWTDAGRKAFGMEFTGFLADQSVKEWAHINPKLRNSMKRYGINKADWNDLRTTKHLEFKGAKYLRPEDIMERLDLSEARRTELVEKFMEMILTETDFAVPTPDARVRAITTMGTKRGTFVGEAMRSAMMFKSFPITVITSHMVRGAMQHGLKNKAAYLGTMTATTTVLGAVAIQMKELSRGKDSRPMDTPEFWTAAFVQGGGAGIWGDFLFSDVNRFGRGPIMTLAGPVAEFGESTLKLTVGNLQQLVKGEDTNFDRDLIRYMRGYTPGGSLWYTRLAFERTMLDQLDLLADKGKAKASWRRMVTRRRREYDQGYWWKPGKLTPDRPPQ